MVLQDRHVVAEEEEEEKRGLGQGMNAEVTWRGQARSSKRRRVTRGAKATLRTIGIPEIASVWHRRKWRRTSQPTI